MSAAETASRLGLHRAGREWRGACPSCGYPAAFVLCAGGSGRPLGWCSSCQDRDGIAAVLRDGTGYQPRAEAVLPAADRAAQAARKTERALALWRGAEPVPGTPAERYLASRHVLDWWQQGARLSGTDWVSLRYRADTPHPAGGRLPALLAMVRNAMTGEPQAIHRTYLTRAGIKADIEPAKASLGPVAGGAVMLWPPVGDEDLLVAEGIESALAAGKLCGLPCWSAVACGNLARSLALPPELVRGITIAVDHDPAGERAAREAAWRWQREGRDVRLMVPDRAGADAADVLAERGMAI